MAIKEGRERDGIVPKIEMGSWAETVNWSYVFFEFQTFRDGDWSLYMTIERKKEREEVIASVVLV